MSNLSLLLFIPLVAAAVLFLLGGRAANSARWIALLVSVFELCFVAGLGSAVHESDGKLILAESAAWIPTLGIVYSIAIDGVSWLFLLLTTILTLVAVATTDEKVERPAYYFGCLLLLLGAVIGAFVAVDLFLFYLFWELMLIPLYALIGCWGGAGRVRAALQFVVVTVAGSILMLAAIGYLGLSAEAQTGAITFEPAVLKNLALNQTEELLLCAAFMLAFLVKAPILPFHGWLRATYTEAPAPVTILLSGIIGKLGLYGIYRFAIPIFPDAASELAFVIGGFAAVGSVYAAFVAWSCRDVKQIFAYSSMSHVGICVLGLVAGSAVSQSGAMFQAFSHGLIVAGLFTLGSRIWNSDRDWTMGSRTGQASTMPLAATLLMVFMLGSIGLPLTSGFVGELLLFLGSFERLPVFTLISMVTVVLGAVYMLSMYRSVMFGESSGEVGTLSLTDVTALVLLGGAVLLLGVFPGVVLELVEPSVRMALGAG